MTQVQEIEAAVHQLSEEELDEFRERFEQYLEDRLELKDEVKAKIQEAREDIAGGRVRVWQLK